MNKYKCTICNYIYDEKVEKEKFSELSEKWTCPVCNAAKSAFVLLATTSKPQKGTTVSEILINQMVEWGINHVFGLPGTSALGVVDAIRKNNKVKFIQVRHEQTAAFMASAYGKLTGHVAACLAIAGPGATNLATGLYDAKLDNSPVLALTGLVKRQLIGPGSFQEIDQHSFFEPICVFNNILMSKDQTTSLTTLAIKHALLDRGVAHISIPNDIQKIKYSTKLIPMKGMIPNKAISQCGTILKKATISINQAKKPVIIAGYGANALKDKLLDFAQKISAPIVTTFKGKGVIDEENEYYMGSHGGIGSTAASKLVQESDLLIVIGSSFSEMTQIPAKKIIQIDIDPNKIAKKHPVEVGLWGNSIEIIPKLTKLVKKRKDKLYLQKMRKLKQSWISQLEKESISKRAPIRPPYIISQLNKKIAEDAIISIDVGENGWWFGRNFFMKQKQDLIMSGYLASMGSGLPGALAAQLAYPKRQVICITGDGGFSMVMADFLTAVKYNLPIKIFLFNNKQLGMILQEQKVENYPKWQTELHNCDFAKYAENCGGVGIKVENSEELPAAINKALSSNKPVIVDINTDPKRFI